MTLFWMAPRHRLARSADHRAPVNHIFRPPGHEEAGAEPVGVVAVCLERGLRSLIIIGAIVWLAYVWHVDVGEIASRDTLFTRILRGSSPPPS